MNSIVLELQQEILNPSSDIITLLRKSHVIATKLQLSEFDKWILSELNGYSDYDLIPGYRTITGSIKAWNPYNGWIPVLLDNNEFEAILCNRKLGDALSKIIELENKSGSIFYIYYNAEINKTLGSLCSFPLQTQYALSASAHQLHAIIEQVKNAILEWTIKLENEGILGENMQFNQSEKESAKRIPQTVNNYYGNTNVINGDVDSSAIVSGNGNSIFFSYEKAKEAISEVKKSLESEQLSTDDQETAMELLEEINEKVSQKKKRSVIKSALIGLKDFLISVGASLTASLIQSKLQGLF